MDISSFIHYALYTKILTEPSIIEMIRPMYIIPLMLCIFIYNNLPEKICISIERYITSLYDTEDECSILLPFHTKQYAQGFTRISKTIYSETFLAINHELRKRKNDVYSLIEQLNFENTYYIDDTRTSYIYLPTHNQKIQLCPKRNIYIELMMEEHVSKIGIGTLKGEKENEIKSHTRQYKYKISKKGKENLHELLEFIEKSIEHYTNDKENKGIQKIYEFEGSKKDENDELSLLFKATEFHSNKTFENIFIENKDQIMEEIREFSKTNENKEEIKAKYKHQGTPYKRTYLLHGPPGCGKSSLIKAFISETGRDCMIIPWSRIKSAGEFSKICRVNYEKLKSKDVIIVFEDFDANSSSTVKKRQKQKESKPLEETETNTGETNVIEMLIKKNMESVMKVNINEDEFTLESVLTTLDGIHELYDSVIVFTTNDIVCLDPALLRPGRIDKIINMRLANSQIICEMLEYYYKTQENDVILELKKKELSISPAVVQEICIRNKTIETCVADILSYV